MASLKEDAPTLAASAENAQSQERPSSDCAAPAKTLPDNHDNHDNHDS